MKNFCGPSKKIYLSMLFSGGSSESAAALAKSSGKYDATSGASPAAATTENIPSGGPSSPATGRTSCANE